MKRKHHHQNHKSQPTRKFSRPDWLTWANAWQLLLPVRACFWGLRWFRWANTKFPKPEEDNSEIAPIVQTVLVIALYFIAYAFYGSQQVIDAPTLFHNFVANFKPIALLNVAFFIMGLFIIYAYLLRVPARQLWAPLACIIMPFGLAIGAFLFLYLRWMAVGDPVADDDVIIRLFAYWVMITSLVGFTYILYRAIRTRLNAYLMHPVLTPLIELTLAAKALSIALQGQATVLMLPHIPSRMLVVALPMIMVAYYLTQTLAAHRAFLAKHHNTTARQLAWCHTQLRTAGPFVGLWRISGTATFRLGIALALLFVATVLFPATFLHTDLLDETQIQRAIDARKSP